MTLPGPPRRHFSRQPGLVLQVKPRLQTRPVPSEPNPPGEGQPQPQGDGFSLPDTSSCSLRGLGCGTAGCGRDGAGHGDGDTAEEAVALSGGARGHGGCRDTGAAGTECLIRLH